MLNTRPSTANMVACLERIGYGTPNAPLFCINKLEHLNREAELIVSGILLPPRGSKIPGTISRTFLPSFRNGRIYTAGRRAEIPAYSRLSLAV